MTWHKIDIRPGFFLEGVSMRYRRRQHKIDIKPGFLHVNFSFLMPQISHFQAHDMHSLDKNLAGICNLSHHIFLFFSLNNKVLNENDFLNGSYNS